MATEVEVVALGDDKDEDDGDGVKSPVPVKVTLTSFSVQAINANGKYESSVTSNDKATWPLGVSFLASSAHAQEVPATMGILTSHIPLRTRLELSNCQ